MSDYFTIICSNDELMRKDCQWLFGYLDDKSAFKML